MPDRMIRWNEAAQFLGISLSTRKRLESSGQFPPAIRVGLRAKAWRLSDLERWLETRAGLPKGAQSLPAGAEQHQVVA